MTTLAELLATCNWPETKAALLWLYPAEKESLDGYLRVYRNLRALNPEPGKMRIEIRLAEQQDDDERPWHEVLGRDGTLNCEQDDFRYSGHAPDSAFGQAEVRWSLSLTPWEKWLGMSIERETLANYPPVQVLAHCLWEISFHGFTQSQVAATLDDLQRQVAELQAMSAEEREQSLIPHDEVMRRLLGDPDESPKE